MSLHLSGYLERSEACTFFKDLIGSVACVVVVVVNFIAAWSQTLLVLLKIQLIKTRMDADHIKDDGNI